MRSSILVVLLVLVSFAPRAGATLVTVPMSGTIDSLFDPTHALAGLVAQGDSFAFTVRYENGVPDENPDPSNGTYLLTSSFSISGHVGTVPFAFDGVSVPFAGVTDGPPSGGFDNFFISTEVTLDSLVGSSTALIGLTNPVGLAISNDSLTGIPFQLDGVIGGWTNNGSFEIDGPNWDFSGPITGMNGVPEPATALLLAGGLCALAQRRRP
jgi:hypothetical protein